MKLKHITQGVFKMKKRLLTSVLSLAFCLTVFSANVSAATPGVSDNTTVPGQSTDGDTITPGTSGDTGSETVTVVEGKETVLKLDNGISIKVPDGALPDGTTSITLSADGLKTAPDGFETALQAHPTMSQAKLYNLTMTNQDGTAISKFNKAITVTLPANADHNDAIYFDETNDVVVPMNGTLTTDTTIEFSTDHFSIYGTVKNTEKPFNPNTGDSSSIVIVSIVALVAAAGLFASKKLSINR